MANVFNENFDMTSFDSTPTAPVVPVANNNQNNNRQNNGFQNNGERQKYNIKDFFWFINPKLFSQQGLTQGEAGMITVGYNLDFDNMRLQLYSIDQSTFKPGAILLPNAKKLAVSHLYPEYRYQMIHAAEHEYDAQYFSFERTISGTGNWEPNKTIINVTKENIQITSVHSKDNSQYFYVFSGWQRQALLDAASSITCANHWRDMFTRMSAKECR